MSDITIISNIISNLAGKSEEEKPETKSAKRKLTAAKEDIPKLTKRKWKLIGGGKILDAILIFSKSKMGGQFLKDGIKNLLGY